MTYTYQDLQEVGNDPQKLAEFAFAVIQAHRQSEKYRYAETAQAYYEGKNTLISSAVKVLYDEMGRPHLDQLSTNHRLASRFFGKDVDQKVEYLLGMGLSFGDATVDIKKSIRRLDWCTKAILRDAMICGCSYGFFNYDRLVHFPFREFAALKDEETGVLMAGVRSWQLAPDKPENITLYMPDGYMEFIRGRRHSDGGIEVKQLKRPYKAVVRSSGIAPDEILSGENYPGFPVIPMPLNLKEESELVYLKDTIDALDIVTSGMANVATDGTVIYWTIVGAPGMTEINDAEFRDRIKTLGVVHTEEGQSVQPHVITPPVDGAAITRDALLKKLYDDAGLFDSSAVVAGHQTATAIQACYNNLNIEESKLEPVVDTFIENLMTVAGIEYTPPTFTPDKVINRAEEIQVLLAAAQFLPQQLITESLLDILGKQDRKAEVVKQLEQAAKEAAEEREK